MFKKNFLIIAFLTIANLLISQSSIELQIYLTDQNQQPVPNAAIILNLKEYFTDSNGLCKISNLEKGTINVFIKKEFYKQLETEIELSKSSEVRYFQLNLLSYELKGFTLNSTRPKMSSPFVNKKITPEELNIQNYGQDIPMLLQYTPSVVSTSDAGNGVGYTGIRIRGSDGTRINVNVNGVPINDAESHGVYWVNMPDLASGSNQIQVQRGSGNSNTGYGSFGGSVSVSNIQIDTVNEINFSQSYGSFNTYKTSLSANQKIGKKMNIYSRLSRIKSDGYIDRASSDLFAYQLNFNYKNSKNVFSFVSFGGQEKTYQSWYGVPESRVKGDTAKVRAFAERNFFDDEETKNLMESGRNYNYYTYPSQVDNYSQNHYQLHWKHDFNKKFYLTNSLFATKGKGYFEEFKKNQSFLSYNKQDFINSNGDTFSSTNLVRQRWLDNWFYGNILSLNYKLKNWLLTWSNGFTQYNGKHFGKVIKADVFQPFEKNNQYYFSTSNKRELNSIAKVEYTQNKKWYFFSEVQFRNINYNSNGNDNDQQLININQQFQFINPKIGITHKLNPKMEVYSSLSTSSREPIRSDFTDNKLNEIPLPEHLLDIEAGIRIRNKKHFLEFNLYNMEYKNQLVLTGEVNDVGNVLRRNILKSYRRGAEIVAVKNLSKLKLEGNATFSINKALNYNEFIFDYDSMNYQIFNYSKTNLSFSPNSIINAIVSYNFTQNSFVQLSLKRVGEQYIDMTSDKNSKLKSYFVSQLAFNHKIKLREKGEIELSTGVNNWLNAMYSSNAYNYKYISGGEKIQENMYYTQAPVNYYLIILIII